MLRKKTARWAARLGVVAASIAVGMLVFASAASAADIGWDFIGR